MQVQKILLPLGCLVLMVLAWRSYGWMGVALVLSALVMWLLADFTRSMRVLRMAGERPVGTVDSAVMLHTRLRKGMPLLRVIALTRSLGVAHSAQGVQPEVFGWTDAGGVGVQASFVNGKLVQWSLDRPEPEHSLATHP